MIEQDEYAKVMAQLRFVCGQVHMLMDLCIAFIDANSDPPRLAQRFEATVGETLAHSDMKLISEEYLDGEIDIVNRIRRNVVSALPRKQSPIRDVSLRAATTHRIAAKV